MLGKVGVPVMEVRSIERELQIEKEKEEPLVQHQQSDLQKWQSHELLGGDNLPSRFDEALIVVNRGCHYKKRTIYSHIPPAQRPVMVYGSTSMLLLLSVSSTLMLREPALQCRIYRTNPTSLVPLLRT